jgi:hypothetical protein
MNLAMLRCSCVGGIELVELFLEVWSGLSCIQVWPKKVGCNLRCGRLRCQKGYCSSGHDNHFISFFFSEVTYMLHATLTTVYVITPRF